MSEWLEVLREEVAATSQARVAKRIGYSAPVVSQVLRGTYKGDLKAVRRAVEGVLLAETVHCPALGFAIRTDQCLAFQSRKLADATAPHHVRLARTCPTCPNNRLALRASGEEMDGAE